MLIDNVECKSSCRVIIYDVVVDDDISIIAKSSRALDRTLRVLRRLVPPVNSITLDVVTRTAHRILAHLGHRTVKGAPCGSTGGRIKSQRGLTSHLRDRHPFARDVLFLIIN